MTPEYPSAPDDAGPTSEGSPLSELVEHDFAALEEVMAQDIAERTKLRKLLQRIRTGWFNADSSADRFLNDPGAARLRALYPQVESLFTHLNADLQRQRVSRSRDLENAIRSFCTEIGQPCHGRYPRLVLAHFVEVSIDETKGRAKVGSTSSQTLEWSKLRPILEREVRRIWGRPFDPVTFRDHLLATYERFHTRAPSPTGYVRLTDLYHEFRSERARSDPTSRAGGRLSAYYRDEFSADLSKLVAVQLRQGLPGPPLDFTSIRRAEDGFSVILPSGDIATYGFVKPGR
jgi:hypothetical protein